MTETLEYIFCEHCETEVETRTAHYHEYTWYCDECYNRLVLYARRSFYNKYVKGQKAL
jgi:hypothetical protein